MAALMVDRLSIANIVHAGEKGQFECTTESIAWTRADRGRTVGHGTAAVLEASWFQGHLHIMFTPAKGTKVKPALKLEGFSRQDYDLLWRFFQSACRTYVTWHGCLPASVSMEEPFDAALTAVEDAVESVKKALWGSLQRQGREADLMLLLERIHECMLPIFASDRQTISKVFAANGCERIGRMRALMNDTRLDVYANDTRWTKFGSQVMTIESMLTEIGTFCKWKRSASGTCAKLADADRLSPSATTATPSSSSWEDASTSPAASSCNASSLRSPFASDEATLHVCPEDDEVERVGISDPSILPAAPQGDRDDGVGASAKHDDDIIRTGWVWKRSRHLRRWRRRWVVLTPNAVFTYKGRRDPNPTDTIMVQDVVEVVDGNNDVRQPYCFLIKLKRQSMYMVCDDAFQKVQWMNECSRVLPQPASVLPQPSPPSNSRIGFLKLKPRIGARGGA